MKDKTDQIATENSFILVLYFLADIITNSDSGSRISEAKKTIVY